VANEPFWLRRILDRLGGLSGGPLASTGDGELRVVLPDKLITDGGIAGDNPRVRVDVGQTGFFDGREFRTFKELNIPGSGSYVVKVVAPINVILFGLIADIEAGHLRMETVVGGTEGGSFSETLPIFKRNNMSTAPAYTGQVVLTAGGTHTGGTVIDVLRLKTNNISGQASSVGNVEGDERGVAANTYYFRFTNLSASDVITGTFRARWEERP
jgi:hypothetical protein